jgi:thiol-disulfide isomerase/thioredoxin
MNRACGLRSIFISYERGAMMQPVISVQRTLRWWMMAITAVGALLYAAAAGAADQHELPRYKLEVGQELSYVAETSSKYENATSAPREYSVEWTALVLAKNDDGSWRVALRSVQKFGASERANVAVCNVSPNGCFSNDPSLGVFVDPSQIFVQLPDDADQLEKGWQAKLAADETLIESSLSADTDRDANKWKIDSLRNSPMNAIYEMTSKQTATFDRKEGLVVHIDLKSTQGWGIKSTSTGTMKLSLVRSRDAEAVKRFAEELDTYLATNQKLEELERHASRDEEAGKTFADDAKALLEPAAEKVSDSLLKTQLEKQLAQASSLASYFADEAKRRGEVVGQLAADWEVEDLDGQKHSLAEYRGKVIVMDFWYRGCGWCIRSMPQIKQVVSAYEGKPVVMLGMNTDRNLDDAKFVVEKMGLKYPNLQATGLPEKYNVRGFPTMVIVDQQGKVHELHVGYSPTLAVELSKTIDLLLNSAPAEPVAALDK